MPPSSPAATLLGLFIAAQLVLIVGANFGVLDVVTSRWANATGQAQGWSLYSGVPHQATYLAVDILCADSRTVRMPSASEPADPARHVRPPLTSRIPGYEFYLLRTLTDWDDARVAKDPEKWRKRTVVTVRHGWLPLRAYLHWQLGRFEKQYPDSKPLSVILVARRYYVPAPGEQRGVWGGPIERPLLRWRLDEKAESATPHVEIADPLTHQFQPLSWRSDP